MESSEAQTELACSVSELSFQEERQSTQLIEHTLIKSEEIDENNFQTKSHQINKADEISKQEEDYAEKTLIKEQDTDFRAQNQDLISNQIPEKQPPSPQEEIKTDEGAAAVLLDFSSTFKQGTRGHKKKGKKKPVMVESEEGRISENDEKNRDLEDDNLIKPDDLKAAAASLEKVPRNITITQEDMALRKHMDLRRWYCIARPQHPKSCGISSLTSCWNFLYSTLGAGSHRPISTEEALEVLGFKPPYQNFDFGSFTGNDTLIQWYSLLNKYYKVGKGGQARILWKAMGKNTTPEVDPTKARELLLAGLKCEKKAFIYHCWNHYFCPIGFELTPSSPFDAYAPSSKFTDAVEGDLDPAPSTWIIIGEVSKCYPVFHVKKWEDIATDLSCGFPSFFNIRKSELGVQEKATPSFQPGGSKAGGNLHCIIEFSSGE